MANLYLEGALGEEFGRVHKIGKSVKTTAEALRLVGANRPGMRERLSMLSQKGIDFIIKRGGKSLDEKDLHLFLKEGDIFVIPVPAGAGGKLGSFFKIVVGTALLIISYSTPALAPYLAPVGLSLISSGIANLLTPEPLKDEDSSTPQSYIFTGSGQNSSEGDPVPLLYGQLRVSGRPIGLEITTGKFDIY